MYVEMHVVAGLFAQPSYLNQYDTVAKTKDLNGEMLEIYNLPIVLMVVAVLAALAVVAWIVTDRLVIASKAARGPLSKPDMSTEPSLRDALKERHAK